MQPHGCDAKIFTQVPWVPHGVSTVRTFSVRNLHLYITKMVQVLVIYVHKYPITVSVTNKLSDCW